jgi:hypothetical protein
MCKYTQVLLPPLCGTEDAPCGEECCQPECTGRQCGKESKCNLSCGTCDPNYVCTADFQCAIDPQVLLCEGDLRVRGPVIPIEQMTVTTPVAEGGTIADGIYDLVATRQYIESTLGASYARSAMRFSAGATKIEQISEGTGFTIGYVPHRLYDVTVQGTKLQYKTTCPDYKYGGTANIERGFSVHAAELWLIQPGEVEVYVPRL